MTLRPTFPDEPGRAKAQLEGHPVVPSAKMLLALLEQPVERILVVIPWWLVPGRDAAPPQQLRFHIGGPGSRMPDAQAMQRLFQQLDTLATEHRQTGNSALGHGGNELPPAAIFTTRRYHRDSGASGKRKPTLVRACSEAIAQTGGGHPVPLHHRVSEDLGFQ